MSLRPFVCGSLFFLFATPVVAEDDTALTRAAFSALFRDVELSDLNLGVHVQKDGTAILWGHAHTSDVARAEAVLKKLPGIVRVQNTCDPVSAADPLIARVAAAFLDQPGPTRPTPVQVARHTVLKPPIDEDVEPVARLRDPEAPAGPMDYAGIVKIRTGDSRYARITFDLRDGRVVVTGPLEDQPAAYELARKIAPLVGNRDVVVARAR
jgi:BON domain